MSHFDFGTSTEIDFFADRPWENLNGVAINGESSGENIEPTAAISTEHLEETGSSNTPSVAPYSTSPATSVDRTATGETEKAAQSVSDSATAPEIGTTDKCSGIGLSDESEDDDEVLPEDAKLVEFFGKEAVKKAKRQTQTNVGESAFQPIFPSPESTYASSDFQLMTPSDVSTSHLVPDTAILTNMQHTPSPSVVRTTVPRQPFTSASFKTPKAMPKTEDEFFNQFVSLPDPETGTLHHGMYRQLKTRYPELRRT